MSYDRFVVTHVDINADCGFVRQLTASEGAPRLWPISFTISGVAEALYDEDGTLLGIRIPRQTILAHVPQIGDELLGVIAHDESNELAYDAYGNLFLRNWFYADQRDIFGDIVYVTDELDDFGTADDMPSTDDHDDIDADSLAEIQHGRALGMYNS